MVGAKEFAKVFLKEGKYCNGKLYIKPGDHARGKTFHIYVIPKNAQSFNDYIEVYGITCGQPGWTENYGWLYKGPWCDDFYNLYEELKKKKLEKEVKIQLEKEQNEKIKKEKIESLLAEY